MSAHKLLYTSAMLKEAYDDVLVRGLPIRKAARNHGLPESTLRLRLSSGQPIAKMGAPTLFTRVQEEHLAQHCIQMAHVGYGYCRWQIMDIAKNMCSVTGREGKEPTKHWFHGFMGRFKDIKMVNPKKREKARDDAVTQQVLDNYFNELTNILEELNIKDMPAHIWNVDETAINLDHNPPKILAKVGTTPHMVTSGRSSNTTLIAAGSALGQTIPPYIIFKGQRLSRENCSNGVIGSQYRATATGWSNSATFLDFFSNHFVTNVKTRPCLLLYDGHSTHINSEVIDIARQQDVHLFVLPPHSSHVLQPLDVSVFGPFKKSLNTEFHKYLHQHPNSVITVDLLPQFIASSYNNAMTVPNIMSGFRKSGIFPLNPSSPTIESPVISSSNDNTTTPTRKERKDNRNVKILFEDRNKEFSNKKEENGVKNRKRKSFIPPHGAVVTEDEFYQEAKKRHEEKKEREEKAKEKEQTNVNACKKNTSTTFKTPFINLNEDKECSEVQVEPTKKKTSTKKGKGPVLQQKNNKQQVPKSGPSTVYDDDDDDDETCVICGKWQPDGLALNKSLKFVNWGQCSKCEKWVHLRFCTAVENLDEEEDFNCPLCANEQ